MHFTIANDHPSLAGHFPDYPVVPGVVVLDEVRVLAERALGGVVVRGVPQVKFVAPLLPGQRADVSIERVGDVARFEVSHAGTTLARGDLAIADRARDADAAP